MYSFDLYGWFSETDIPGRQTDVMPPAKPWPEGKQPNFTGYVWQLVDYVEPHPAIPVQPQSAKVTRLAFLSRFFPAERAYIRTVAKSDVVAEDFLAMVMAATFIDLAREDTINGMGYLVMKNYLTAARCAEILTNPVQDSEKPE